jgi:hypothetical protein
LAERENFIRQLVFKGNKAEYIDISENEFLSNEEMTLYPILIERVDVEKGKLQNYINIMDKIEKKKNKAQGSIAFSFLGYDDDLREIYRIPEICNWMQRLFKIKPHLFYYLTDAKQNNSMMFYCLAELDVEMQRENPITKEIEFGLKLKDSAKVLIEIITASAVSYAKKMKEPPSILFRIANNLMEQLHYDSIRQDGSDPQTQR